MSADISDLVVLLYRTDWTRLSLSATISHTYDPQVAERLRERDKPRSTRTQELRRRFEQSRRAEAEDEDDDGPQHFERRLLIASGGRYRVEYETDNWTACDGDQTWHVRPEDDGTDDDDRGEGGDAGQLVAGRKRVTRPGSEFCGLLTPRWLIARYDLQITGQDAVGGRPAIRVTGTPRLVQARRTRLYEGLDRVEVLVDAELGILLRSVQIFEGQARESAELRDLVIGPAEAGMPEMFAPPPGVPVQDEGEPFASYEPPGGAGWQAAGAAAGVAANALGFAVRHAPRRRTTWPTDDEEPDMPADTFLSPEQWEQGEPPGDALVNLLHRTGLPALAVAADLHQWVDADTAYRQARALLDKIPEPFAGILGPDALWDALGERPEDGGGHRAARLAVRVPGRYRLDYLSGDWRKRYTAIACDGEHTTKLFRDRVATGPARPLDDDLAIMLDPAWLLSGWRLTAAGQVSLAGREGTRIRAVPDAAEDSWTRRLVPMVDLVVDAEFGVLLRRTRYAGQQPVARTELRDLRPIAATTAFRIEPEPGMRAVSDSGSPLADLNLPRPAEVAGTAAAIAAAGAVALTGWLDKHRARRDRG